MSYLTTFADHSKLDPAYQLGYLYAVLAVIADGHIPDPQQYAAEKLDLFNDQDRFLASNGEAARRSS